MTKQIAAGRKGRPASLTPKGLFDAATTCGVEGSVTRFPRECDPSGAFLFVTMRNGWTIVESGDKRTRSRRALS